MAKVPLNGWTGIVVVIMGIVVSTSGGAAAASRSVQRDKWFKFELHAIILERRIDALRSVLDNKKIPVGT